jgi:phosphoglycerate kinase
MVTLPLLSQLPVQGRRVLLRAGFDVPLDAGRVTDERRLAAVVPSCRSILDRGGRLILLAHQGRPKGKPHADDSQAPLVPVLERLLGCPVRFCPSVVGPEAQAASLALHDGEVLLLENLRFDPGEEANDPTFAAALAALGDLYVNDAFSVSHRAHASLTGLPTLLPHAAGLQLQMEVEHLGSVLQDPPHPLSVVLSGAKMDTKIPVIEALLPHADHLLLAGGIANTFLAAQGHAVGTSLCEHDALDTARRLLDQAQARGVQVHLPTDVVCAPSAKDVTGETLALADLPSTHAILDVGPATTAAYISIMRSSKLVVWNGPLGLYETPAFAKATQDFAHALAEATRQHGVRSLVGGGDTLDAHDAYHLPTTDYTFVSTGGGAMLEFLADGTLPAITALTTAHA